MTAQLDIFTALTTRDRILDALAANHAQYLAELREIARYVAQRNGEVTIDDVRSEIVRRGYPMPAEIGADERVFGVVFRCRDFTPIGQRKTSRKEWAARVGVARSAVTVYVLRTVAA